MNKEFLIVFALCVVAAVNPALAPFAVLIWLVTLKR